MYIEHLRVFVTIYGCDYRAHKCYRYVLIAAKVDYFLLTLVHTPLISFFVVMYVI